MVGIQFVELGIGCLADLRQVEHLIMVRIPRAQEVRNTVGASLRREQSCCDRHDGD